jgi:hypothetical protein
MVLMFLQFGETFRGNACISCEKRVQFVVVFEILQTCILQGSVVEIESLKMAGIFQVFEALAVNLALSQVGEMQEGKCRERFEVAVFDSGLIENHADYRLVRKLVGAAYLSTEVSEPTDCLFSIHRLIGSADQAGIQKGQDKQHVAKWASCGDHGFTLCVKVRVCPTSMARLVEEADPSHCRGIGSDSEHWHESVRMLSYRVCEAKAG